MLGEHREMLGDDEEVVALAHELHERIVAVEHNLAFMKHETISEVKGGWTNEKAQSVIVKQMANVKEQSKSYTLSLMGSFKSKLIKVRDCGCPPAEAGAPGKAGQPGNAGAVGAPGVQGDPGLPGQDGEAGAVGPPGKTGPPGSNGEPGLSGKDGNPGKEGRDGLPGQPGPPGPDGPSGHAGLAGAIGLPGPPGAAGLDGDDGLPGQVGLPGHPGEDGAAGAQGLTGADGEAGADGNHGNPGPQGPPGEPGENGQDGIDGAPGMPGSPGKAGADGLPGPHGPEGPEGHEGLAGPPGPDGPAGKDGSPGKDGRNGNPGAVGAAGAPGMDGKDGAAGEAGVGPPGPPGPPGAVGAPGDDPDLEDLQAAARRAKEIIKKVMGSTTEIATRNTDLEHYVERDIEIIDDRRADILALFSDLHVEVTQEVTEVADQVCRMGYQARATPCCPDCTKAKYRTPDTEACEKHGCEYSCSYFKIACDASGKKTAAQCLFPFSYGGEEQEECITKSPYGEVKKPWCVLDTEANKDLDAETDSVSVGFCDCTEIKCVCPEGQQLAADGKSCE